MALWVTKPHIIIGFQSFAHIYIIDHHCAYITHTHVSVHRSYFYSHTNCMHTSWFESMFLHVAGLPSSLLDVQNSCRFPPLVPPKERPPLSAEDLASESTGVTSSESSCMLFGPRAALERRKRRQRRPNRRPRKRPSVLSVAVGW